MGLKRSIADAAEKLLGVKIVKPSRLPMLFEERHLERFLDRFEVDCVFDVGANAGQYATSLRERIGFRGHIISFEPNPDVAIELRAKAAPDSQWHVEELALDIVKGTRQFNVMAGNQFSSLHRPDNSSIDVFANVNRIKKTITVDASTVLLELNRWQSLLNFKRPFLKMDTQGHDMAVAQGAGDSICKFVGLQSELSIRSIYEGSTDFSRSLDYYQSRGFVLSAFVPNNEGHFPDLVEIDCIMYNRAFARR